MLICYSNVLYKYISKKEKNSWLKKDDLIRYDKRKKCYFVIAMQFVSTLPKKFKWFGKKRFSDET